MRRDCRLLYDNGLACGGKETFGQARVRGRETRTQQGIVENGLVHPVDATIKLPEHSRVIIVAEGS
jgi:hypothetical protein